MEFPTEWYTTELTAGSVENGKFNYNIPNLSASTCYEYRAYAIIGGIPYYGNILSGVTLSEPWTTPSVETGCAENITQTSLEFVGNRVTNKGGLPLAEYGILYTQIGAYGNNSCMVYNEVPAKICKLSCYSDIATSETYFCSGEGLVNSLVPNQNVYFRAFARNGCGVSYGEINCVTTLPPESCVYYCPNLENGIIAFLGITNPIEGETYDIKFNYSLNVYASISDESSNPDIKTSTCSQFCYTTGDYWIFGDAVCVEVCAMPDSCSCQDTKNGTIYLTNVTNLSNVKFCGSMYYPQSIGFNGEYGDSSNFISIELVTSSIRGPLCVDSLRCTYMFLGKTEVGSEYYVGY